MTILMKTNISVSLVTANGLLVLRYPLVREADTAVEEVTQIREGKGER